MLNIEKKMEEFYNTRYSDAPVYDVQISYFGDEVTIVYEDKGTKCWKVTFLLCGKVSYETDALWENWRDYDVKGLKTPQLGYFAQNFTILPYKDSQNFIECSVDLSIMTMKIICRDIKIEHCDISDFHFFWQDNDENGD